MDSEDPDSDLDYSQNWIISSFYLFRHILKTSSKSVHKFLSYLVHKRTNPQTNPGENITSLADVTIASVEKPFYFLDWEILYTFEILIYYIIGPLIQNWQNILIILSDQQYQVGGFFFKWVEIIFRMVDIWFYGMGLKINTKATDFGIIWCKIWCLQWFVFTRGIGVYDNIQGGHLVFQNGLN